jgi:uncharacterized DUF497 family protein
MEFDWSEANRSHIARHGVTTSEAEEVLQNSPLDVTLQTNEGEERTVQVGETDKGRVLVVVTTWRGEKVRVVTSFPASARMRRFYLAKRARNHGTKAQDSEI